MSTVKILVVDDSAEFRAVLCQTLEGAGYVATQAASAEEALRAIETNFPDLVLLDVNFPGMSGYQFCETVRLRFPDAFLPIILLSGDGQLSAERIKGLESGAYEFLSKPIGSQELLARVASFLKVQELHRTAERQRGQLAAQMALLKRFFSPQVSDSILTGSGASVLNHHKRDVTICFVDLRGFTSFAEVAEPEVVIEVISQYYSIVCALALNHGGTISSLAGDGIMLIFNDPVELPNHTEAAVNFAFAVRRELTHRANSWNELGYKLGFGAGIARGESIMGAIGFEQFVHYTAISSSVNLAARLCQSAEVGQVLSTLRALRAVEGRVITELVATLSLKGIEKPVNAVQLKGWRI
jgi:adenylate cyclase